MYPMELLVAGVAFLKQVASSYGGLYDVGYTY
jgi:hypothetical protein